MPGDIVGNMRWFQHGHYKAKFQSGLEGVLLSRPLLEGTVRRHVQQLPNVRIVDHSRVLGLLVERMAPLFTAFACSSLAEAPIAAAPTSSSMLRGRGSRFAGVARAARLWQAGVEEVNVGIGYTTRIYRRLPGDLDGDMRRAPRAAGRRARSASGSCSRWRGTAGS